MHFYFPVITVGLISAIIAALLVFVQRYFVAIHILRAQHEVAFPIFLQTGLIFGVLIAFIFSMVWNEAVDSYKDPRTEVTNIIALAELANAFPQSMRQEIDNNLIKYSKRVIYFEWPKMQQGQEDTETTKILSEIETIYLNFNPQSERDSIIYAASIDHLSKIREYRRLRIMTATSSIHFVHRLWFYIITLGLIVISTSYFFGMKSIWVQAILTAGLAFTISTIIAIIISLTQPFSGQIGIEPVAFKLGLSRIESIAKGGF